MTVRELTRRQLYELVWTTPMTKLAPQFGISDVALRKKCHKYDIPTPGLGYWAQLAVGQAPEKAELPTTSEAGDQISFDPAGPSPGPPARDVPTVTVDEQLADPHSAVVWLDKAFASAKPDQHGRLVVGHSWSPDVCLRETCRERALRVLDALFKALEARGHRVEARVRGEHSTSNELLVDALGDEFSIEIEEKLGRNPHVLTAEERREKEKYAWSRAPKYDYFPSGELKLKLGLTHWKYQGRKSWSDTKTQRLDDLLGQSILAIEDAAEVNRREQTEQEERARLHRERERNRLRGERLNWYRLELAEELRRMAADWKEAAKVREFLAAYEATLNDERRTDLVNGWLEAAKRYADKLDPLRSPEGIAKELDPSDEVLEQLIEEHNARAEAQEHDG